MERTEVILMRKDVMTLSNDELALLLLQMKTLMIMSPKTSKDAKDWPFDLEYNVNPGGSGPIQYVKYTPQNRYDALISNHASCCQHNTPFFPYWHRVQSRMIESSLLNADELLSNSTFPANLYNMPWSQNSKILRQLKKPDNFHLLQKVSTNYRQIKYKIPNYRPALHYFNLMKYIDEVGEPKKFRYPRGFSANQPFYYGQEHMDQVIQNIYQQKFWEFNHQKRWYDHINFEKGQDPYHPTKSYLLNTTFIGTPPEIIEKVIRGDPDYNFSSQNFNLLLNNLSTLKNSVNSIMQHVRNRIGYEQMSQYMNKKAVNITPDRTNQLNFLMGGAQCQYVKGDDKKTHSYQKTRNKNIPYYNYTIALHCVPQKFFNVFTNNGGGQREFSIETAHNQMHNNQFAMMNDAKYSIMNPIFCLYHGFMDYLLEVMIRKIKGNYESEEKAVESVRIGMKNYASGANISGDERGRYLLWGKYFKKQHGFDPTFEDYPIFFWMDFYSKDISTQIDGRNYDADGTSYFDLILEHNRTRIRPSTSPPNLKNTGITHNYPYDFDAMGKHTGQAVIPYYLKPIYDATMHKTNTLQPQLQLVYVFKYPSTMETTSSIYEIYTKNSLNNQELLFTRVFTHFSRGPAAQSCPRCPKVVKIEEFIGYVNYVDGVRQILGISPPPRLQERDIKKTATFDFLNVPAQPFQKLFTFRTENSLLQAKLLRGRSNLKLELVNDTDYELTVSLTLNHKQDATIQERDRQELFDAFMVPVPPKQTRHFVYYKEGMANKSNISSIMGNFQYEQKDVTSFGPKKYTFCYVFNYYANTSLVKINFLDLIKVVEQPTMRMIGLGYGMRQLFTKDKIDKIISLAAKSTDPSRWITEILQKILTSQTLVEDQWYQRRLDIIDKVAELFAENKAPNAQSLANYLKQFIQGANIGDAFEDHRLEGTKDEQPDVQVEEEVVLRSSKQPQKAQDSKPIYDTAQSRRAIQEIIEFPRKSKLSKSKWE